MNSSNYTGNRNQPRNSGAHYGGGSGRNGGYPQGESKSEPLPELRITEDSYVDDAEKVIVYLEKNFGRDKLITTSQLRNILSMAADIYNQLMTTESQGDTLAGDLAQRIDYLRVRCVYASGRDRNVKRFLEASKLVEQIRKIGGSRKGFMLFYRYMEALVAYNSFHGGKDN